MAKKIESVRDLKVYKAGFSAAMEIFNFQKSFQQKKDTH